MRGARWALLAAAGLLAIAFVALVLRWVPGWLAPTHGLSAGQRAEEVERVRTSLLTMLAGGVAIVGVTYTIKTFRLNLQGQLTERFTRAIDQLGSSQIDVCLGGIYALGRIARESKSDHGPIMEILAGYIREHAPHLPPTFAARGREERDGDKVERQPGPQATRAVRTLRAAIDVQAALSVIAGRVLAYDSGRAFDLSSTDLRGCDLRRAALAGIDLSLSDLSGANLRGVDLTHAEISEARLTGATLTEANLTEANLSGASLAGADLVDAVLNGAVLTGCELVAADLTSAYLADADLSEADLTGATLIADLSGANLTDAVLDEITLAGSVYTAGTRWPSWFEPLEHGAVEEGPASAPTAPTA
jgi:uncharacterized protein YjbI with pentapeptide repeats